MRNDWLVTRMKSFLGRLSPPRVFANNEELKKQEQETLIKTLLKIAPTRSYGEWWNLFEEHLMTNMDYRTWPTLKEMHKAAEAVRPAKKEFSNSNIEQIKIDECVVNAKRIKAGEPVGEIWLKGRNAEELIRRGLVTEYDLAPYLTYLDQSRKRR